MTDIAGLLGAHADSLLNHVSKAIPKESLHLPGPDFVDRVVASSDRSPAVMRSLQQMFDHGRLGGTGYLSILPVDQGIEHSAGASFAKNPIYFDPENIVKLAMEGGCNAVASTLGVLGAVSRKYAHRIPFMLKFNHNEFLTYPNKFDQICFARIKQAKDMGAVSVGATIYFGSAESSRQIVEVSEAFQMAHELGLATILWCYLRNPDFKRDKDYHVSADLTGQANHLGVTIEADIIKQKLPENNGGFLALNSKDNPYGKSDKRMYSDLATDHPIDLTRYQIANCYMGRAGLINSGWRLGGQRSRRCCPDRRDQQARWRHGPHLGPQGVPEADPRGRSDPECDPGCLPGEGCHHRLIVPSVRSWCSWRGLLRVPRARRTTRGPSCACAARSMRWWPTIAIATTSSTAASYQWGSTPAATPRTTSHSTIRLGSAPPSSRRPRRSRSSKKRVGEVAPAPRTAGLRRCRSLRVTGIDARAVSITITENLPYRSKGSQRPETERESAGTNVIPGASEPCTRRFTGS